MILIKVITLSGEIILSILAVDSCNNFFSGSKDDDDADDIGAEEEPLNSADDVSEEEQSDLFDTDNVVVCQYDKVSVFFFVLRNALCTLLW